MDARAIADLILADLACGRWTLTLGRTAIASIRAEYACAIDAALALLLQGREASFARLDLVEALDPAEVARIKGGNFRWFNAEYDFISRRG
jgi:hypothetical protein